MTIPVTVRWVPGRPCGLLLAPVLAFVLVAVAGGFLVTIYSTELEPNTAFPIYFIMIGAVFGMINFTFLEVAISKVGLSDAGVRFVSKRLDITVPWQDLSLSFTSPRQKLATFVIASSSRRQGFTVNTRQYQAIVKEPRFGVRTPPSMVT